MILCAAAALLAPAAWSQPAATIPAASEPLNLAGLLSEVIPPPLGFDDPYSWMVGGGAFYERRFGGQRRLVLGGRVAVYGQYATEPLFGWSMTTLAGPFVGWEIVRRPAADLVLAVVPYIGAVQYWRRFEYDNAEFRTSRAALLLGVNLDLVLGTRMVCGVASEPMLILDRTPRFTLGQIQRLAVRF